MTTPLTVEEFRTKLIQFLDNTVSQDALPIGQDYDFDWEHDTGNLYIKLRINESVFTRKTKTVT
jgi:hypothetical protein